MSELLEHATLLIDADITLYRAASACEREVRWDDHNHVLFSNSQEVWDGVLLQVESYKRALGDHPMHFALTGGSNFRKDLWDGYKGGRTRKPLCYGDVRQRLIDEFDARSVETLEADDLLGIWATGGKIKDPVIVSLDKDLKTIPGTSWRPPNGKTEACLTYHTEDDADYAWMVQTLTGDVTDGYTGLPGCGPKSAEKILDVNTELDTPYLTLLWWSVVAAYEAKGLGAEDALLQARLARILRASDWDGINKKVKLWEPK